VARVTQIADGWLMGRQARPLFGTDWKQLWATPIAEVSAQLGLELKAVDGLTPEMLRPDMAREPVARA